MSSKAYARRYAQAIFEIAQQSGELERWQTDLEKIEGVVGDAAFKTVLENPKYPIETKMGLLNERLKTVNPLSLNLVRLLILKGGIQVLGEIIKEFRRLSDSYLGIEHAEVVTAIPLNRNDEEKLKEHLGSLINKQIIIESKVDPNLVGGLIVRMGDKLLDGSIRSKLSALRDELAGSRL